MVALAISRAGSHKKGSVFIYLFYFILLYFTFWKQAKVQRKEGENKTFYK